MNLNSNEDGIDLIIDSDDIRLRGRKAHDMMPGKTLKINGVPYISLGVRRCPIKKMHQLLLASAPGVLRVPSRHFTLVRKKVAHLLRGEAVNIGGVPYYSLGGIWSQRRKEIEIWFQPAY